jgi:hypothetical protein
MSAWREWLLAAWALAIFALFARSILATLG